MSSSPVPAISNVAVPVVNGKQPLGSENGAIKGPGEKSEKDEGGPVNGIGALNGEVQKVEELPLVNGSIMESNPIENLPGELQQFTMGYVSLGKLVERVTQVTFNDLNELLEELASSGQENGLTNGARPGAGKLGEDQASLKKRLEILNWTKRQRERLIQLAVLLQWSKDFDQKGKYIDLMMWSNDRYWHIEQVEGKLIEMKQELDKYKKPSPDIRVALEVLSTGKASWMPDLGFLPLAPLTPQKMLETLEDMNIQLHIRLTLHEDIPHYLRNYNISNGRVTFIFPDLFEFDLTISEEDAAVQLWFVDLRFLFTPTITLDDGAIRQVLQISADNALAEGGVPACAEMLRNYVLTHQITILSSQSIALSRGLWRGVLKSENVHRSLIVSYWTESPFPKSWIEIGISSGKTGKRLPPGRVQVPKTSSRWRRYGEEAPAGALDLRLEHVSIEGILRRAIARHTSWLLSSSKEILLKSANDSSTLSMELHESSEEPTDCKLELRLGSASPLITFAVEQFSGRLTLHPQTEQSIRAEIELNKEGNRKPLTEVANILEFYLCLDMVWRLEKQAVMSGWELMNSVRIGGDQLGQILGTKATRFMFFRPRSWEESRRLWVICVTISLAGSKWWALEM
jgi:mediator of RNA polymerase II transcription subunit 14